MTDTIKLTDEIETPRPRRGARHELLRRTAIVVACAGLAGCESVPDYANPVKWYEEVASAFDDEEEAPPPAEAELPEDAEFPNLATATGTRPETTVEERRAALNEGLLSVTGEPQTYSDQTLQAGAAPTPAAPPPSAVLRQEAGQPTLPAASVPPSAVPPSPVLRAEAGGVGSVPSPLPAEAPVTLPPGASSDPYVQYYGGRAPQPLGGPVQQATLPPPAASGPTPPPVDPSFQPNGDQPINAAPGISTPTNPVVASTFAPLPAPPQPIMNRRTAAPAALASNLPSFPVAGSFSPATTRAGIPANFTYGGMARPFFAPGARLGTIYFDHGSARLGRHDRSVLQSIAEIHRQQGGTLMLVGHASRPTEARSETGRETINFRISGARSDAVAGALSRYGVARQAIRYAALSDNLPEFQETEPNGEAGNRRVVIYLTR